MNEPTAASGMTGQTNGEAPNEGIGDDVAPSEAQQAATPAPQDQAEKRSRWTLTEDGCRTEVRLGLLLSMAGVFVWLWQGPSMAVKLYFPGFGLLLLGLWWQIRDAQTAGRPGYPTKAGIILFVGGLLLSLDVMYREDVGGPLQIQPIAPMVTAVGFVVLLGRLWLVIRGQSDEIATDEAVAAAAE